MRRVSVLWMVLRDWLTVVAAGVAAGVPLSLWLSRLVNAQLFGLSPHDPLTLTAAITVLALVAALAGYLPARRASGLDPVRAPLRVSQRSVSALSRQRSLERHDPRPAAS